MNQTQRDLFNLFFRRDSLRERIYPTRVTYLAIAVTAMVGMALLCRGRSAFPRIAGADAVYRPLPTVACIAQQSTQTHDRPLTLDPRRRPRYA